MTMQQIVAANVRARLAWGQISHDDAARAAGCSIRSFRYKVSGEYGFRPDELAGLAELIGVEIGTLFRVPEGFVTSVSESAWTRTWAGRRHLRLVAA